MKIVAENYQLKLEYPFGIASYTRTTHDVVLIKITYQGLTGYGEASMAKYLGETPQSVHSFLKKIDKDYIHPEKYTIPEIYHYLNGIETGNTAAKAAVDIAVHDLYGKIHQQSCYKIYQVNPENMPVTSLTVGIDKPEIIREKVRKSLQFKSVKVKLGSGYDKAIVEAVKQETDVPLYIDANQGWTDKHEALDMICWLQEKGAVFVEQPMDKNDDDANGWITEHSPLPIIADEAMQRLADVDRLKSYYSGINIKLMKCAGMYEASEIIKKAQQTGLKIMIGCMTETSCAIMAAAALAPLCDWADLDGPWLITNNPYATPALADGKIILSEKPGLGLYSV